MRADPPANAGPTDLDNRGGARAYAKAVGGVGAARAQRTLAAAARVEGHCLFSARRASAVICPAGAGQGVVFRRVDVPGSEPIPACVERVKAASRRTALAPERGGPGVETVEHVLSALAGLGIDNAVVEVDGPELPIGDGSALFFVEAIERAGVADLGVPRTMIAPARPLTVQDGPASIAYFPATTHGAGGLELTYVLDYTEDGGVGGPIPRQVFTCVIEPGRYAREVAPARTFSTRAEAEAARAAGLFGHLSTDDLLVIGDDGPIGNSYRFPDEPARHKLLDLLGDLSLAGGPLTGRVVAVRSGHALNHEMARALRASGSRGSDGEAAGAPALDIRQIVGILPHRYPMLMVDRVVSLEPGVRAVGLKNVSINEPYFVGHYPAAPVMPGVLICEAMSQLAGLMLKDVLAHQGKVALLLAMDEVRWRRPVVPGDQLVLEAVSNKANARMADVSCRALVEGVVAAEARVKFMVVDPSQLRGGAGGSSGTSHD